MDREKCVPMEISDFSGNYGSYCFFKPLVISVVFHCSFFQDGLKTADKLKQYIEKLAADLYNVFFTKCMHFDLALWINNSKFVICILRVLKK